MDAYPPGHPTDYPYSSSMSEADSLSDSDWLDISSNKDSEDDDSVSSRASDHDEVDYNVASRRSSLSIGSSRDGEIEAWEGLADEESDDDELRPHDDLIGISIPPTLPPALRKSAVASPLRDSAGGLAEDRNLNTVIDQSLTGALSASRSSSSGGHASTAQNSIRDLRLSFPDPLTSSRDQILVSYDEVSASSEPATDSDVPLITATRAWDLGSNGTPGVLRIVVGPYVASDLEIVLYGAPTLSRWSVVTTILEKAAAGGRITLSPALRNLEGSSQSVRISGDAAATESFPKVVNIIDRTLEIIDDVSPKKHDPLSQGSRPSLAIIFATSANNHPVVPDDHTSYVPIYLSPQIESHPGDDWQYSYGGKISRPLIFQCIQSDCATDIEGIARLEPQRVYQSLMDMMDMPPTPAETKTLCKESERQFQAAKAREQLLVRFGVAGSLIAIIAILLARFYFPGTAQLPTRASPPPPSHAGRAHTVPVVNKSSVAANSIVVHPSTLKEFALALFDPPALSTPPLSPASQIKRSQSTTTAVSDTKKPSSEVKPMSWSEHIKSSTDLILPGSSSLSSFEARSKKALTLITSPKSPVINNAEKAPSSLSIRLVDSLTQIVNVNSLSEVVRQDMKELSEALDELMIHIGKQTTAIMNDHQGAGHILRERLKGRHGKAKARAQQIKSLGGELGSQLLSYVGTELQTRADQAKSKARQMADTFASSEAWNAHKNRRAHERKQRREDGGKDKHRRREARRAERQTRRTGEKGRKKDGLFF